MISLLRALMKDFNYNRLLLIGSVCSFLDMSSHVAHFKGQTDKVLDRGAALTREIEGGQTPDGQSVNAEFANSVNSVNVQVSINQLQ